jgi:serine/threonine-protein phosphatase 6 regulatory ankyrin repeat subunit B
LLKHGANVNSASLYTFTPLYIASREGHVEVLRELLNKVANVNAAAKEGFSPLHIAGLNGNF